MSGPAAAGLFIYAKDLSRLADFYESILGLARVHVTPEIVVLRAPGIELVVHAIPASIAASITISDPPQHREDAALKFFFTVPSLAQARLAAAALSGEVLREQWSGAGFSACNAIDPEGNIFQVRERAL
jgi:predicted enzyme related to lactoylglutathione lyase